MTTAQTKRDEAGAARVMVARVDGGCVTVELYRSSGDAAQDHRDANTLFRHVLEQRSARQQAKPNALPPSAFDVWAYRDHN
jgi:hypothetical protein